MAVMQVVEGSLHRYLPLCGDKKNERDCEGQGARSQGAQRNNFFNYILPDR